MEGITPDPIAAIRSVGWPEPSRVERVTGGWDTLLWRFPGPDGRPKALRLYRLDETFGHPQKRAQREEAALRLAAQSGLPVPPIEAVGSLNDAPFFILGWMPGRTLVAEAQRRPWQAKRLGFAFGRLQARLHGIDAVSLEPGDEELLERVIDGTELLAAAKRELTYDSFCHLDFHPLNVLAERGRISALLDFSGASRADRRLDLGMTSAALTAAPAPLGPLRLLIELLRRRFTRSWRAGYEAEAGHWPLTPLFEAIGAAIYARAY